MAITDQRQGREAFVLYASQASQITATTSIPVVSSLGSIARTIADFGYDADSGAVEFWGIGTSGLVDLRPGAYLGRWRMELGGVESPTFLNKCVRGTAASATVPWITLGFGIGAAAEWSRIVCNCKSDEVTVRIRQGEPVTATINGIGGYVSQGAVQGTHANAAGSALLWDEGTWTNTAMTAIAPLDITGLEVTVRNNLDAKRVLGGSATVAKRLASQGEWDHLKEGRLGVTGVITCWINGTTFAAQAAAFTEGDPTVAFKLRGSSGTQLSVALTDCMVHTDGVTIPEAEGEVEFNLPFTAKTVNFTSG